MSWLAVATAFDYENAEQEKQDLIRCIKVTESATGERPRGSPRGSESRWTRGLLQELGFVYTSNRDLTTIFPISIAIAGCSSFRILSIPTIRSSFGRTVSCLPTSSSSTCGTFEVLIARRTARFAEDAEHRFSPSNHGASRTYSRSAASWTCWNRLAIWILGCSPIDIAAALDEASSPQIRRQLMSWFRP